MSRQFERHATKLEGRLHTGPDDADGVGCDILDLSVGGAKVRPQAAVAANGPTALAIGNIGRYDVEVVWARNAQIGLKFRDGPEAMADVIMAVALYS